MKLKYVKPKTESMDIKFNACLLTGSLEGYNCELDDDDEDAIYADEAL